MAGSGSLIIIMAILAFGARFAIDKMLDTTSSKVRFGIGVLLFCIYTVFIEIYVYWVCTTRIMGDMSTQESISIGIAVINFTVLLVMIFYYLMRKKRNMSSMDKMKIKDL